MDPLSGFHPIIRRWFESRFASPTEAQALGWPAIARNRHTLISAPTGSGKTLAAFLICIDRLFQSAIRGELPDSAQVVYVSPLKALSNDIHKNLSVPLEEIVELARQADLPCRKYESQYEPGIRRLTNARREHESRPISGLPLPNLCISFSHRQAGGGACRESTP